MQHRQSIGLHWVRARRESGGIACVRSLRVTRRRMLAFMQVLRVYRIRLKMREEDLRQTHQVLDESNDRQMDFFDTAPAAYLCLSPAGIIINSNSAAKALFGLERRQMQACRFVYFIEHKDHERWAHYLLEVLKQSGPEACSLQLLHAGSPFYARIAGSAVQSEDGRLTVRLIVMEIPAPLSEEPVKTGPRAYQASSPR